MFLVLRSTKILEGLKRFFNSVFRKDSIQEINDDETEGWNDFFRNAIPPKHYFSFAPLVLESFFTAALYGGIIFVQPVISFCSIFILIGLTFTGSKKWSWWSAAFIYFSLALSILHRDFPYADALYYALLNLVFSYFLFFGRKDLRIPATLALLFLIAHSFTEVGDPFGFVCFFVFSVMRYTKWRLRILLIVSIISISSLLPFAIYNSFYSISSESYGVASFTIWSSNFISILVVFLLCTLYIGKGHKITAWLYTVFAFALRVSLSGNAPHSNPFNGTRDNIITLGKKVNTNPLQEKLDRPIEFVEQPISYYADWQTKTGASLHVLLHYFTKTILPYPLAFYYGYKFIDSEKITETFPLISLLIHLLLVAIYFYFLKRNLLIGFEIGFYLISLLPFANYFIPIPSIVADRYLLNPSIGWSILLMAILFKIGKVNDQSTKSSELKEVLQLSPIFKYCFCRYTRPIFPTYLFPKF